MSTKEPTSGHYFRLSVTLLLFAFAVVGIFEYITGAHRPDPFAEVDAGTSWQWWRYPLPEESSSVMPLPVGVFGKFIERGDYDSSHAILITPGQSSAELDGVGPVELVDFAPFEDGSGWALAADGKLYARVPGSDWQQRIVSFMADQPQQVEPVFSGTPLAAPETNAPVNWAEFSPDPGTIVARTEEGEVLAWSVTKGDWLWRAILESEDFATPSFAPKQPLVMFPGRNSIVVFNWETGKQTNLLRAGKGGFTAAAFTPRGEIMTSDQAFGMRIWDSGSSATRRFSSEYVEAQKIIFSPDGELMAVLARRGDVSIYDFASGERIKSITPASRQPLRDIAFTRDGRALILLNERSVQVLAIGSFESLSFRDDFEVLQLAPANDLVLGRSDRDELIVWRYTDKDFFRVDVFGREIVAAVSPAGDLIAAQTDGEPVRVFGHRERELTTTLDTGGQVFQRLIFSPDGGVLVAMPQEGDMRIWNLGLTIPKTKSKSALVELGDRISAIHFLNSRRGWLVTKDSLLLATSDGGLSWQKLGGTVETKQAVQQQSPPRAEISGRVNDVHFISQVTGWIVGDDGLVAHTADGGANWTASDAEIDLDLLAVHFVSQDIGLAVGTNGVIQRSEDGGLSWSAVANPTKQELHSVTLLSDGAGWISSTKNDNGMPTVLKTLNTGESWELVDYSELPAPLLLFVIIPLLALAVFIVFYQRPQTQERRGVDPAGSSDKPIGWGDPDPLNFQPIAKGLSYFLRNKDTEPPLTIGINGPWGTGKSSLMNLVMEDLRQYGCSPVWFNAWHHQKEEHLLAALLENIRKQAVPRFWQREGILFRLRLLWLRTRNELKALGALAILAAGLFIADQLLIDDALPQVLTGFELSTGQAANAAVDGTENGQDLVQEVVGWMNGEIQTLGSVGFSLGVFVWLLLRLRVLPSDPAKLLAGLRSRVSVRGLRDQLGFRYRFGSEFKQVCKALRSRSSPGLVILIDDLDRCKPQNVLEVLESVNYLATVGDCFIILGMARRQVENCVAIGFKDFIVEGMEEEEHGLLNADDVQPTSPPVPAAGTSVEAKKINPESIINSRSDPGTDDKADGHATTDQRRFARRYLEKLINIEVAVPRDNAAQAAGLFAREKTGNGMDLRLQRRQLMYTVSGLAQVLVIGLFLGAMGAGIASLIPESAKTDGQLVKDQGQGPDITQQKKIVDPEPKTDNKFANGTKPRELPGLEVVKVASLPVPISSVQHTNLTSLRSPLTWWGPSALFFILMILITVQRRLRPLDTRIKDTPSFTSALERWYPLIYAVNPTPRGIKRFENRIRFIAMQARPPHQEPDIIDRIIDFIEKLWSGLIQRRKDGRPQPDEDQVNKQEYKISDDMLVALGTVEVLDMPTIKDKGVDDIQQLVVSKTKELKLNVQPAGVDESNKFIKKLGELEIYLTEKSKWKLSEQDLEDYRRLSGQVRG